MDMHARAPCLALVLTLATADLASAQNESREGRAGHGAVPPDGAGESIYVAPEDGGPRQWEVAVETLNMRERPSTRSAVVETLGMDTVLSNLGCAESEGRIWCDVQPAQGGARGYVAADFLAPRVDPSGGVAMGEDDSAMRAGQRDFDATGSIPCARSAGQPTGSCEFGVARAGGGWATVVVTFPDGFRRALFFAAGDFAGADASEAGGGFDTESGKEADLYLIRVDDERYEIPQAVVFGG